MSEQHELNGEIEQVVDSLMELEDLSWSDAIDRLCELAKGLVREGLEEA